MGCHGYSEVRTIKIEVGPDGKKTPHVYIEKRELTEEEARKVMDDQAAVFKDFDQVFSGFDGIFARAGELFKGASEQFKKAFGRRA